MFYKMFPDLLEVEKDYIDMLYVYARLIDVELSDIYENGKIKINFIYENMYYDAKIDRKNQSITCSEIPWNGCTTILYRGTEVIELFDKIFSIIGKVR